MKSLLTLTSISIAAVFVAPAHAYERCQSFANTELKAMTQEGLEKAYCRNEDRLLEILQVVASRQSDEAKRDRDACWDTLLKLSAQPQFDRDGPCSSAAQAGAVAGGKEMSQKKSDLLRNLGIAGEKDVPAKWGASSIP